MDSHSDQSDRGEPDPDTTHASRRLPRSPGASSSAAPLRGHRRRGDVDTNTYERYHPSAEDVSRLSPRLACSRARSSSMREPVPQVRGGYYGQGLSSRQQYLTRPSQGTEYHGQYDPYAPSGANTSDMGYSPIHPPPFSFPQQPVAMDHLGTPYGHYHGSSTPTMQPSHSPLLSPTTTLSGAYGSPRYLSGSSGSSEDTSSGRRPRPKRDPRAKVQRRGSPEDESDYPQSSDAGVRPQGASLSRQDVPAIRVDTNFQDTQHGGDENLHRSQTHGGDDQVQTDTEHDPESQPKNPSRRVRDGFEWEIRDGKVTVSSIRGSKISGINLDEDGQDEFVILTFRRPQSRRPSSGQATSQAYRPPSRSEQTRPDDDEDVVRVTLDGGHNRTEPTATASPCMTAVWLPNKERVEELRAFGGLPEYGSDRRGSMITHPGDIDSARDDTERTRGR